MWNLSRRTAQKCLNILESKHHAVIASVDHENNFLTEGKAAFLTLRDLGVCDHAAVPLAS